MKKYIVELIGTFFLVFTIGNVVIAPGAGGLAPLAIGSALMVMIYAGGHISGGHYNPAVTLAVFLRGKCPPSDVPGYMASQIVGAILAAVIVLFLKDNPPDIAAIKISPAPAIVAELLGTFALAWVVLNAATAKGTAGNSFYGLAIGFTVMVMAFAVGGISGGAFNPAVGIGLTVMHLVKGTDLWIHLIADFAGGALAAYAYRALAPADEPEKASGN